MKKINKPNFTKIKIFCSAKDTVKRMKRHAITLIKNCYPKYQRTLKNKKTWFKKGSNILTFTSTKIDRWQISIWKGALYHTFSKKSNWKGDMTIHILEWPNPDTDNIKCWQWNGAIGTLIHCWWKHKVVQSLQETVLFFLTKLNTFSPYDSVILLLDIYPKEMKT